MKATERLDLIEFLFNDVDKALEKYAKYQQYVWREYRNYNIGPDTYRSSLGQAGIDLNKDITSAVEQIKHLLGEHGLEKIQRALDETEKEEE